jgi:CheY-like chemotaxis protein
MPLRVLVVEDEQIVSADIAQRLARMRCDVVGTAVAGVEAVKMALLLRPDMVLMDIRLEGEMDGIEAARLIQRDADIPVVFITGFTHVLVRNLENLGYPDLCLVKPVVTRQLQRMVDLMRGDLAYRRGRTV